MRFARAMSGYTQTVQGLGDSISEGTIVEWVKQVGEYAEKDEVGVRSLDAYSL